MKKLVDKIDGFLESQKITWLDKNCFDLYRSANDTDFEEQKFAKIVLKNQKGKKYRKQVIVSEELFLVFDEQLTKLEKDLSKEWKKYQEKIDFNEKQTTSKTRNFNKYLDEEKYDF